MGWFASSSLRSPSPRKCICHGWTCSTKSWFGSTGPPASSTRVLSPCSVSSLAAQPPDMPEPTTIASKCVVSRMVDSVGLGARGRGARALRRHRRRAVEATRHHLDVEDVLHHALAREVAVDDEALEAPVRAHRLLSPARRVLDGVDDSRALV